jgi:hypothetical protein
MPKPSSSIRTDSFSGKPGYLLLIIAATIYFSELVIMISFKYMPPQAYFKKDVLDATVLTTIVFPVLYLFVFRPLTTEIKIRRQAEKENNALINELNQALAEVKTLQGIIPICSSCKKIRDDEGFWHQLESYVSAHSHAQFSHGICNDCLKKLYPEQYVDEKK